MYNIEKKQTINSFIDNSFYCTLYMYLGLLMLHGHVTDEGCLLYVASILENLERNK